MAASRTKVRRLSFRPTLHRPPHPGERRPPCSSACRTTSERWVAMRADPERSVRALDVGLYAAEQCDQLSSLAVRQSGDRLQTQVPALGMERAMKCLASRREVKTN